MIVTKKYIQDLREKSFLNISEIMEKLILEKFGKEPKPDENGHIYEYTEQDIFEQIRKMISN
ncbi:hypothetical protein [Clostridium pasteurianum]|uniref:Uncharacterized protein n=1 Tax=Clostridium pasteurianum BC1 TaxID=86416 RepID=R4K7L1_CLOPA|nr:hypothetical protein [Clostridium pasteurianum]AGK97706.1 hypothetical protein Clopa_2868 [Clostridium pasteurianum BC1]